MVAVLDRWQQLAASSGQIPFLVGRLHETKFSQSTKCLRSNGIDDGMHSANDDECGAKFDIIGLHGVVWPLRCQGFFMVVAPIALTERFSWPGNDCIAATAHRNNGAPQKARRAAKRRIPTDCELSWGRRADTMIFPRGASDLVDLRYLNQEINTQPAGRVSARRKKTPAARVVASGGGCTTNTTDADSFPPRDQLISIPRPPPASLLKTDCP